MNIQREMKERQRTAGNGTSGEMEAVREGTKKAGTEKRLLQGAAILGLAAVVSKLLGTLQKIPLQNIAGDEVFGIYNAVYPLYILILTLATAGIPIAVSKLVSDYAGKGDLEEAKRVFRTALGILTLTGAVCFAGLYAGAETIAAAIGMKAAAPGIRCVSFALLAAPAMATFRGFYQGLHDMMPTAISQVAEQTVRVAVMIALLLWLTERHAEPAAIAAGAAFGSTAGVAGGMAAMLWCWRRRRGRNDGRGGGESKGSSEGGGKGDLAAGPAGKALPQAAGSRESTGRLIRRFLAFAVPVCLGSIALPALTIVDTFTVPRLLAAGGMTEGAAAHRFGLYNHGMPLVQLVTMVAASMSAALVPSVAEAAAAPDGRLLQARTEPVLRFTWVVGLGAAFGLSVTSLPLNVMFFESPEGWQAMSIVAFTALFGTLHVVTGCMLQGLGAVMVPARSLFVAAGLKAAGNLLLVPAWGIEGAALAAVLAYAAAGALNLRALQGLAPQAAAPPRALLRPLAAALCMSAAVLAVEWGLLEALHRLLPLMHGRLRHAAAALAAVACGAAVFAAALFRLGAVGAAELAFIPGFDTKWKPVLERARLLPKERRTRPQPKP